MRANQCCEQIDAASKFMNRAVDFRRGERGAAFIARREDSLASRVRSSPGREISWRSERRHSSTRCRRGSSGFATAAERKPNRREADGRELVAAFRLPRCGRSRRERDWRDGQILRARVLRDERWRLPWCEYFVQRHLRLAQKRAVVGPFAAEVDSAGSRSLTLLNSNLDGLTAWAASNAPCDPSSSNRPAGSREISSREIRAVDARALRCPASVLPAGSGWMDGPEAERGPEGFGAESLFEKKRAAISRAGVQPSRDGVFRGGEDGNDAERHENA